jgi:hypothetical protein
MGFRLIFIIAVIVSFTGKSTYLSIANLEMGESEVSELSESKYTPKEESKSEFYSLFPEFVLHPILFFSRFSFVVYSLVTSTTASPCMNRGPPALV